MSGGFYFAAMVIFFNEAETGFRELLQMTADEFDFLFLSLRLGLAVAPLRSCRLTLDI